MKNEATQRTGDHSLHQLERQRLILQIACCIGTLNFIAFVTLAFHFGGDALNGKVENGHYYVLGVATRATHKIYTEVSKQIWNYSRIHAISVMLTWPVLIVAVRQLKKLKPKIVEMKMVSAQQN